jgi:hypothetical protein
MTGQVTLAVLLLELLVEPPPPDVVLAELTMSAEAPNLSP